MKKTHLVAVLIMLASNAYADESRLEAYSETSKGETAVCGANFYAASVDQLHNNYVAAYGSVFIMPSPKGVGTVLRVDAVEGKLPASENHNLMPVTFAQLSVHNPAGEVSSKGMTEVNNAEDPLGYSSLSYDGDKIKLLGLSDGATLLVQLKGDVTDMKFEIAPADKEFVAKMVACTDSLIKNLSKKK